MYFCPGYVNDIDALACAEVSNSLGAGRTKAGQDVDLAVGLVFSVDVGSFVKEGEVTLAIATIYMLLCRLEKL